VREREASCDYTYKDASGVSVKCNNRVWAGVPLPDGQGRVFSGPLAIRLCWQHAWPALIRRREATR
jgi:hypothetical protein